MPAVSRTKKKEPKDQRRAAPRTAFDAAGLALACIAILLYLPVLRHDFTSYYDDQLYVTANPQVRSGLSWHGLVWALTAEVAANWHPLTLLSHMTDVSLFGLHPWGHHLTSILLHAANTWLLYRILGRCTGMNGRSALVAALFAAHPLHVESVAWIAERKDVLSSLFCFLTLSSYVRYAERPAASRYVPVVLLFALGLAAKPMLVTLPFVLLLLDYWPLRRFASNGIGIAPPVSAARLLLEKIPLLALAAAVSMVTILFQRGAAAVSSLQGLPLAWRLENALTAYAKYLGKVVWPINLAVFYPHPGGTVPWWTIAGAAALLVTITAIAVRKRSSQPYLIVGWLLFMGMLVPVIGIVQAGDQAMADRYMYLPVVGLLIAAVWGAGDVLARYAFSRGAGQTPPGAVASEIGRPSAMQKWAPAAAVLVVVFLSALTLRQISFWSDQKTLFEHAIHVTGNNHAAETNLGGMLLDLGKPEEAREHLERAVAQRPTYSLAQLFLADALTKLGESESALEHYRIAAQLNSSDVRSLNSLGKALVGRKLYDEAAAAYAAALRREPTNVFAQLGAARAYDEQGRYAEAEKHLAEAAQLEPRSAAIQFHLAETLEKQGKLEPARSAYARALQLDPSNPRARDGLARVSTAGARR